MRHVSLVALYGPKPDDLSWLIKQCQDQIAKMAGRSFHPYDLEQIHATIIGLDQVPNTSGWNLNYWNYRQRSAPMRFGAMLQFLRSDWFPFQVQIAGFQNRFYALPTRIGQPYQQTFSLQDGKVILRGWPVRGDLLVERETKSSDSLSEKILYPPVLGEIRQAHQGCNILHKYHEDFQKPDNDFYFRIGLFDQDGLQNHLLREMEQQLQEYLGSLQPIVLTIDQAHLFFVSSEDETFPCSGTTVQPLDSPELTTEVIVRLYKNTLQTAMSGAGSTSGD